MKSHATSRYPISKNPPATATFSRRSLLAQSLPKFQPALSPRNPSRIVFMKTSFILCLFYARPTISLSDFFPPPLPPPFFRRTQLFFTPRWLLLLLLLQLRRRQVRSPCAACRERTAARQSRLGPDSYKAESERKKERRESDARRSLSSGNCRRWETRRRKPGPRPSNSFPSPPGSRFLTFLGFFPPLVGFFSREQGEQFPRFTEMRFFGGVLSLFTILGFSLLRDKRIV